MNARILNALSGKTEPRTLRFKDLKVGTPFKWVKENDNARRGVCLKLGVILDGSFHFSGGTGKSDYGWTSLATDDAGIVYHDEGNNEVIPL